MAERVAALLVDLDGTLVDTEEANFAAYAAALEEAGVRIDRAAFHEIAFGRSWKQFLPVLLSDGGSGADPALVAARKVALYPGMLRLTRVNHALVRLIEAGRPGWKTALVTTASSANASAVLQHHGLARLFDAVITGSDVARHKPDPEAYQLAAERLDVRPAECIVIEDSAIGLAAGVAFGATCLKVGIAG